MLFNRRLSLLAVLLGLTGMVFPQQTADATDLNIASRSHILDSDDPSRIEFGKLVYLSGIVMRSDNEDFGGLSGLQISPDGRRLLAVTDKGKWLAAELVYEGARLTGLANAEIAALLGRDGQMLDGRGNIDAEALSLVQPENLAGPAYVSFEGNHRIWLYPDGLRGPPVPVTMPRQLGSAPANKGMEALARRGDGALIALTEAWLDDAGNPIGWLIGKDNTGALRLRRERDFSPTDLAFLANGDLLVLERRYTMVGGPGMQIRLIKADTLIPDAVLDGEVLINLTARYGIDNFEGLAVRQNADGETIIYLVSDDNFNPLQKNLLLMFKLKQQP